ncbi:MAG: hypothetical protein D6766_03780 [Verrucomicrobia bacterium]|nr:MAG: hypothetical protein D6766_03780 [Verrucomicrobiota bacterium]
MGPRLRFRLESVPRLPDLPPQVTLLGRDTETPAHLVLKLLGWFMFHRPGLRLEPPRPIPGLRYRPDLLACDAAGRPELWVECGDCRVAKLRRVVRATGGIPLRVLKSSEREARLLWEEAAVDPPLAKSLRVIGFHGRDMAELLAGIRPDNLFCWLGRRREPPSIEFELNGLWHQLGFRSWPD